MIQISKHITKNYYILYYIYIITNSFTINIIKWNIVYIYLIIILINFNISSIKNYSKQIKKYINNSYYHIEIL